MASYRSLRIRELNALTRKIPYGRMPRWTIMVGISREHLSIVY
jgi:hypothetical protein